MVSQYAAAEVLARTQHFASWMLAEQKRVFLLCLRLLEDTDEADSATQDVFFKAYQALQRTGTQPLDDPARWLTRIAVNTCLDRLRSRRWQFWRRRAQADGEDRILSATATSGPSAEDRLFAAEIRKRLHGALGKLSHRQQAVFALKHYDDRSLEEIAQILKLDLGTVKAHMARAVAKLRAELRDVYEQALDR